jgi:hypothetical protein
MNFFPNLQPYVNDSVETQNVPYDYKNNKNLPNLPPIGYFASKKVRGLGDETLYTSNKENVEYVCNPTDGFVCKYSDIKIGTNNYVIENLGMTGSTGSTGTSGSNVSYSGYSNYNATSNELDIIDKAIKNEFKTKITNIDLSFLDNMNNLLCQLPNIMIMLGYKYSSGTSEHTYKKSTTSKNTYPNIILKVNETSTTNVNNQEQFNACQTVMSRSRLYDIANLLTSGLFFGIKDLFIKLKSIKILLTIILLITVYLLVQGTVSSADVAFKIASLVSNRSYPSYSFVIGIILGIGLPALISIFISRRQIQRTNVKFGKYDITNNPYGTEVPKATGQEKSDTALVAIMLGLAYVFIFIIYYMMRDKNNSPIIKIGVSAIFYILLTCIIFLLFYWAPIVSYANDEEEDRAFGISRPLKVWTKGDDNKEISSIISNKYIDRYLRRYFAIYAIVALSICIIYLAQSNTQQKNIFSSFIEGIMASCAIIALPILWIFNWYTGITLFIAYPMILMIARYFRYPLYYLLRQMYLNSPKLQSDCSKLKQEFDHPESYTAPWDLMGVTLFKYFIKFNCGRSLYSDLFVDYRDGYRDISGNSYVTGHVFRMMMKDKNGPFDYYHHGLVFIITIIVFIFLIFGVVGKENAF